MATLPRAGARERFREDLRSSADTCNSIFSSRRRLTNSSSFVDARNRGLLVRSPEQATGPRIGVRSPNLASIKAKLLRGRSLSSLSSEKSILPLKKSDNGEPKESRLAKLRRIFEPGESPLRPRLRSYSSPPIPLAPTPLRRTTGALPGALRPLEEQKVEPSGSKKQFKSRTLPRSRDKEDSPENEDNELFVLDMRVKIRLSRVRNGSSVPCFESRFAGMRDAKDYLRFSDEEDDLKSDERGIHPNTMTSSYHQQASRYPQQQQQQHPGYHGSMERRAQPQGNPQYYAPTGSHDNQLRHQAYDSGYHDNQLRHQAPHQRPRSGGDYERVRDDDVFSEERVRVEEQVAPEPLSGASSYSSLSGARVQGNRLSAMDRVQALSADNLHNTGRTTGGAVGEPSPLVKMRHRKARDKGLPTERPRSWHASKHPDLDTEGGASYSREIAMRSPTGMYNNPQPRGYNNQAQGRRRSRGWCETGELKSVYNGSKDSLISGGSHFSSSRSNRLSASSSRSSGTNMSSSRGSLDNLDSNSNYVARESYPQVIISSSRSCYKQPSPSQPHPGIVSKQKNRFEKLTTTTSSLQHDQQYSRSREDLEKISRVRRTPSDDADRFSGRENSRSPSSYQGTRRSSFSPPPYGSEKSSSVASRSWRGGTAPEDSTTKFKFSDARIVKTSESTVPEPPQRDSSSIEAMKHYHVRSHSAHSPNDPHRYSTSPDHHSHPSPPGATSGAHHPQERQAPLGADRLKSSEKINDPHQRRQERVFGVMATGKSKEIRSLAVSPKTIDHESSEKTPHHSSQATPPRYELLKDSYSHYEPVSGSDYVSRKISEHQKTSSYSDPITSSSDHSRGGSAESGESGDLSDASRGRGRYGVLWKTPQVHRRTKSSEFLSVTTGEESAPKLSVFKTKEPTKMSKSPHSVRPLSGEYNSDGNQRSIMNSLRQSQPPGANYEMLWPSGMKSPSKDAKNLTSPAESNKNTTSISGWSQEDDLDQASDEVIIYRDTLQNMSRKVLRETSFKGDNFQYQRSLQNRKHPMKNLDPCKAQPVLIPHARSRSYGNEMDDLSEKPETVVTGRSFNYGPEATPRDSGKQRPKSAGVARQRSNRHAPIHRTPVAPTSTHGKSPCYPRKSESLPRNMIPSFGSDDSDVTSPTQRSPFSPKMTSVPRNRRISIDVKPECESPKAGSGIDPRVIQMISQKSGKNSVENSPLNQTHTSSSMSIYTSHSDETDKRRRSGSGTQEDRMAKTGSSGDIPSDTKSPPPHPASTPTAGKPQHTHVSSVRRLPNFQETRAKFLQQQNKAPLLPEDESGLRKATSIEKKLDRSASLELLVDEGIGTESRDHLDDSLDNLSPPRRDRSVSSPIIKSHNTSPDKKDSHVHPPPRTRPKKRYSNSSSASSSTTVSSLSTLSNTSSTSIGKFPTVDEANEQGSPLLHQKSPTSPTNYRDKIVLNLSPLAIHHDAVAEPAAAEPAAAVEPKEPVEPAKAAPMRKMPFNTNTYRVKKEKKKLKRSSREGDGESGDEQRRSHVTKIELRINNDDPKPTVTSQAPPPAEPPKPVNDERVNAIIEKVKRSTSFKKTQAAKMASGKGIPPPPPPPEPQGDAKGELVRKFVAQNKQLGARGSTDDLPPPPPPPPQIPEKTDTAPSALSPTSQAGFFTAECVPLDPSNRLKQGGDDVDREASRTPTTHDTYREVTYLLDDSDNEKPTTNNNNKQITATTENNNKSRPASYENVHINGVHPYENVFTPIHAPKEPEKSPSPVDEVPKVVSSNPEPRDEAETEKAKESPSPTPKISVEPLLPDVPLHPASSLEQEHPDLTRDIIKGDKTLAQMLQSNNKKTLDFMAGVLPQSSRDILQEGMRYRMQKPDAARSATDAGGDTQSEIITNGRPVPSERLLVITCDPSAYMKKFRNDIFTENLPASSQYYKTSASKAKILSIVKERMASQGDIEVDEDQEEINRKKMELVLSIKGKLDELHSMKHLLELEMRENETLGRQVLNLTKQVCKAKEQEKYNIFVKDVDHIINLLLSLSSRLARVENAIQMLPLDAESQEMDLLCEKRKKLAEQHNEAKGLKENIDRRQKAVSEILASYFDHTQFADYEHYIKMKSALIMEQRELMDKSKLGEEQMQCLRDSLPDDWQTKLDKLLDE